MDIIDFELRKKIQEMLSSGRFLIAISYVEGNKINHYTATKNFPRDCIVSSFEKIAENLADEVPIEDAK